jgi:hypothetical protein
VKVKQHRFRALITLGPAAGENAGRGHPGRTHASCLVQPCPGRYFPALISAEEEEVTARAAIPAVISTPLAAGEAEAFFAPGQRFTIWADAVVGHSIHADRLIGQGIIAYPVALPPSGAHGGRVDGKAAGPARRHRPATLGVPAAHDRGQHLAV